MAIRMKNQGRVVAWDKSKARVAKLQQLVNELDLSCVECYAMDATKSLEAYPAESFDRVLLDPPCSGIGT